MLNKVSKALLISDVASFSENYKALAEDIGVSLQVESEWKAIYRINADIVILGSKNLQNLNETYYPVAVLLLKENESPAPYIKMGITRFIFNYKNKFELLTALFRPEAVLLHSTDAEYEAIVKSGNTVDFCCGDYDFRFDSNLFRYRGKLLYLTESVKKYLAEWLLHGHKDNSKRMIVCNLRKKFGKDFLSDIDRYGRFKGGIK